MVKIKVFITQFLIKTNLEWGIQLGSLAIIHFVRAFCIQRISDVCAYISFYRFKLNNSKNISLLVACSSYFPSTSRWLLGAFASTGVNLE